jgi:hypothetical protein
MKLMIRESKMKYDTYGNWEKAYNILVGEKGYSHDEAQEIIFNIKRDYKYNPNALDSIMRRVNQVLPKDEYEREYGIKESANYGRFFVTDDDYIPLPEQPNEGYTENQAILRAQREAEQLAKLFKEPISKTAKMFHIMDYKGNIRHDLDTAI